jgi:hypothetical protein
MSIQEVLFFSARLQEQSMPRDAFVVNRVHQPPRTTANADEAQAAIDELTLHLDDDAADRLVCALSDETRQATSDRSTLARLDRALGEMTPSPLRVNVPAFPYDVHDIPSLARVAAVLAPRL